MRSLKRFLMAGLFVLVPTMAFAQEAAPVVPDWLQQAVMTLVGFLSGIPAVGPVLAVVFQVLGIASAVLTAISLCVQGVLVALSSVAKWSGLAGVAEKIKAVSDKILPWLKYLSMFNVQKK